MGMKFPEFLHVDSNLSMVFIHFTFSSLECLQCVLHFFPGIICFCQKVSLFPLINHVLFQHRCKKDFFCFQKPIGFTKLCVDIGRSESIFSGTCVLLTCCSNFFFFSFRKVFLNHSVMFIFLSFFFFRNFLTINNICHFFFFPFIFQPLSSFIFIN